MHFLFQVSGVWCQGPVDSKAGLLAGRTQAGIPLIAELYTEFAEPAEHLKVVSS